MNKINFPKPIELLEKEIDSSNQCSFREYIIAHLNLNRKTVRILEHHNDDEISKVIDEAITNGWVVYKVKDIMLDFMYLNFRIPQEVALKYPPQTGYKLEETYETSNSTTY